MIEHELILLGLLKENPKHGYEIKKKIKEIVSLFGGMDFKSIYYPLQILEKKGFLTKHTSKFGKRPQRFIYELTPKGKIKFQDLLTRNFLDFKRPRFSLDLSLYFLDYIQPDIAKRRLRARSAILKKLVKSLQHSINSLKKKKSASLVYILEHNLQMVETELKFLSDLVKHYKD